MKNKTDESQNLKPGWYWLVDIHEPDPTLVYYYENNDAGSWGFGFNISDGSFFLPEDDLAAGTTAIPAAVQLPHELNPADAIFAFCAWLTTREEKTVMSASNDSAVIAALIKKFVDANELSFTRGAKPYINPAA